MSIPTLARPADPFDLDADATRADFTARRPFKERDRTCELVGKPKRKKADFNPKQRDWFTRNGWTYYRVETANAFGGVNVDCWGFADYLACKPGEGVLLVQTCAGTTATGGGSMADREKKARSKPELWEWLKSGGRFQVHGWRQPGGPGSKWEVVIREVTVAAETPGEGRTG